MTQNRQQTVTRADLREVNEQIREDLDRARARGRLWTVPREFVNDAERLGATRCARDGCRKAPDVISYAVRTDGRVAYCGEHEPPTAEREVLR